jgi:hypothetical protein
MASKLNLCLTHLEFLHKYFEEKKWSEDGPTQEVRGDRKLDMATRWTMI